MWKLQQRAIFAALAHTLFLTQKSPLVPFPLQQCEKIVRFLKVLGNKFAYKSSQKDFWLLAILEKSINVTTGTDII